MEFPLLVNGDFDNLSRDENIEAQRLLFFNIFAVCRYVLLRRYPQ